MHNTVQSKAYNHSLVSEPSQQCDSQGPHEPLANLFAINCTCCHAFIGSSIYISSLVWTTPLIGDFRIIEGVLDLVHWHHTLSPNNEKVRSDGCLESVEWNGGME